MSYGLLMENARPILIAFLSDLLADGPRLQGCRPNDTSTFEKSQQRSSGGTLGGRMLGTIDPTLGRPFFG